ASVSNRRVLRHHNHALAGRTILRLTGKPVADGECSLTMAATKVYQHGADSYALHQPRATPRERRLHRPSPLTGSLCNRKCNEECNRANRTLSNAFLNAYGNVHSERLWNGSSEELLAILPIPCNNQGSPTNKNCGN